MPTMSEGNEAHLVSAQNGHCMSVDCWCEPVSIRLVRNRHDVLVLVVEHTDDTLEHRIIVTARRERDRHEPYANTPNNGWITRVLTPPWTPLLLPPHEGSPQ